MVGGPGEPVVTVALGHPIDPSNAPRPSNDSERLLFRQVYETLVGADCTGRVVPRLAASWTLDGDGRTWIVTLRADAYFSDGTPVSAADVRAGWLRDGSGDALHPRVGRIVDSIVPVDDRAVAIRLHGPQVDMPLALAHPDLSVAKVTAGAEWPLGTRAVRVAEDGAPVGAVASSSILVAGDDWPAVRFLVARGDPRDVLDAGVDLLITRDPATLEYAATLPQYASVPMAWQRTHVLLAPARSRDAPPLPDGARQRLAEDAVRGEARGARGPFWWDAWAPCGAVVAPSPGTAPAPLPRIVYDAADAVARDLAERFVGLTRAPDGGAAALVDLVLPDRPRQTFQRAAGLSGAPLRAALRRGADAGYIVALDRRPLDACRDLQALRESAPWLEPQAIVPLVDTRAHAVLRRGVSGLTADWDGGLLIAAPNTR